MHSNPMVMETDTSRCTSADEVVTDDVALYSEPDIESEAEHTQLITDKKASALFLLKAKEVNKISQSSLNTVIQDFTYCRIKTF